MKTAVIWKDMMTFEGATDRHRLLMDAKPPLGKDAGPTPKELVALGLGGCTAMDVIALLKKYKQSPQFFRVEVEIGTAPGHPAVFEKATLTYSAGGAVDAGRLIEAVRLSQTKYCGVSAMLSKSFPIEYHILLNGQNVGGGTAAFESAAQPAP